jgi:excisionase family DNA binding protein
MKEFNEVMTAEELAQYLQVDEQTIYRKARVHEIPAVYIGKTVRFKRDVIDGWLRISSLNWTLGKREKLRDWAQSFATEQGITEGDLQKAISKRRARE